MVYLLVKSDYPGIILLLLHFIKTYHCHFFIKPSDIETYPGFKKLSKLKFSD